MGGLRKGGKGYYCLDITNASTAITSETTLASRVAPGTSALALSCGDATTPSSPEAAAKRASRTT